MTPDTGADHKKTYTDSGEVDVRTGLYSSEHKQPFDWRMVVGSALLVSGIVVLAEEALKTGYLPLLSPLISGVILVGAGWRDQKRGYFVGGSILCGIGLGLLAGWLGLAGGQIVRRIGVGMLGLVIGFAGISALHTLFLKKLIWWPLVVAWAIGCLAFVLTFTPLGLLDFVFYLVGGLGVLFLAIGVHKRLLGLMIPGCLLLGIGPGISFAWTKPVTGVAVLAQTGTMLVWFSLGWALITLTYRMVFQKIIWWPLIPGGILAVVGWGLYIGGNPGNAASFIGNTGSVVMIIFGLYLLLMRRGIRK